jgi:hypothetical protein
MKTGNLERRDPCRSGGEARDHLTAYVRFRDGAGHERRAVGVAIRYEELRPPIAVLTKDAARLDATRSP